jgi:hypothetical protein
LRLNSFGPAPDVRFRACAVSTAREEHDVENRAKEELANSGEAADG